MKNSLSIVLAWPDRHIKEKASEVIQASLHLAISGFIDDPRHTKICQDHYKCAMLSLRSTAVDIAGYSTAKTRRLMRLVRRACLETVEYRLRSIDLIQPVPA